MCCHENTVFSPYKLDPAGDDRHPSYGFRKEWADWLVRACEDLQCSRVEVYGEDNAQTAQKVTPLPLQWASYRDYVGLEKMALPLWLRVHQG